jgi:hypothetical protein
MDALRNKGEDRLDAVMPLVSGKIRAMFFAEYAQNTA